MDRHSIKKHAVSSALQEWRWCKQHGINVTDEERLTRSIEMAVRMADCMAMQQFRRAERMYNTLQKFAQWDEKRGEYVAIGARK